MPIAGRKRLGVANPVRQRGLSDLELGMRDAISARDEPDDQRRFWSTPSHPEGEDLNEVYDYPCPV